MDTERNPTEDDSGVTKRRQSKDSPPLVADDLDLPDVPHPAGTVVTRLTWQTQAACRGLGPGGWVQPGSSYEAQRAVCAVCSVRRPCLSYALADPKLMGCWGGTDDRERRAIRQAVA